MCNGKTTERHETNDMDEISFGGIDCKPYSFTYATKMQCNEVSSTLLIAPNTPGYKECACADGSEDWKTTGCCLAGGMLNEVDLAGWGCLYPVPGLVGPNFLGKNGDVGRAIETWIAKNPPNSKISNFMCPEKGVKLPQHKELGFYEQYESKTEFTTYYDTGRPRIQQDDAESNSAVPYVATVSGTNLEYTGGTGKLLSFGLKGII